MGSGYLHGGWVHMDSGHMGSGCTWAVEWAHMAKQLSKRLGQVGTLAGVRSSARPSVWQLVVCQELVHDGALLTCLSLEHWAVLGDRKQPLKQPRRVRPENIQASAARSQTCTGSLCMDMSAHIGADRHCDVMVNQSLQRTQYERAYRGAEWAVSELACLGAANPAVPQ
jgi:hypothetical protein